MSRATSDVQDRKRRLELYDRATERQRLRNRSKKDSKTATSRGWDRTDLYSRAVGPLPSS